MAAPDKGQSLRLKWTPLVWLAPKDALRHQAAETALGKAGEGLSGSPPAATALHRGPPAQPLLLQRAPLGFRASALGKAGQGPCGPPRAPEGGWPSGHWVVCV